MRLYGAANIFFDVLRTLMFCIHFILAATMHNFVIHCLHPPDFAFIPLTSSPKRVHFQQTIRP